MVKSGRTKAVPNDKAVPHDEAVPHEQFAVELAELALGVLYGPEQAALRAHIGSCANCATDLQHLDAAVEGLLLLAPEVDPPVGFAQQFLHRINVCGAAHRPEAAVDLERRVERRGSFAQRLR
jgi:hypothetical protein